MSDINRTYPRGVGKLKVVDENFIGDNQPKKIVPPKGRKMLVDEELFMLIILVLGIFVGVVIGSIALLVVLQELPKELVLHIIGL